MKSELNKFSKQMLSIVIPTYNEQESIIRIVNAVESVGFPIDHEIIIVDDASTDHTYEKEAVLKRSSYPGKIRIFKNKINKGKGFSIRKGIRRSRGNFIIIQDADNEYDPRDIPKLLEPILQNRIDVVYGSRFLANKHPNGMAIANLVANRILTGITNILFGLNLTDMETCYKIFRSDVIKDLPLKANRFSFEPEVTALLGKRKIRILELPIGYKGRSAKEGKKIKGRDFIFAILTLLKHKFVQS